MEQGRLAIALVTEMSNKNISMRELAHATGKTYEHIRKLLLSQTYPSKDLLKIIAEVLGLDVARLEQLAAADKIEKRYGGLPAVLARKNPEMGPVEKLFMQLSPAQKKEIMWQMEKLIERNREEGVPAA